jgi:predicted phage tail protein
MLIKLHGIFAEDFGPEHRIEANTIAEAIEGLTRQLPFYTDRPLEQRPVCKVAGIDDPKELFVPTEQKEIHLVPAMIGGGGVGRILVGAAIIATALIIGPAALGVWFATMITVGATIVLSGAMQIFMKAPTIKGNKDPEQSKYMNLGNNSVAIGTPIAIQYGRGPASGHLLAVNVDAAEIIKGTFPVNTS